MIIQDIFSYIKDRCGEENTTYVIRELNRVLTRVWLTTDLPGTLFEMVVTPADENVIILPWYVGQVKAVQRLAGVDVTLYTPRATFQDNAWRQDLLQWVFLTETPRLRQYTNIGRLTLRLKRAEATPFTVTVIGPSEFGGRDVFENTFAAGDLTAETVETVRDLTHLSKSRVTATDVEVLDNRGVIIALLPAERTHVYNKQIRIADQRTQYNNGQPCNRFRVLYKTPPPVFTSANEAIDDSTGLILQELLAADLLAKDEKNARRTAFHGRTAEALLHEAQIRDNEGKSMPVKLTRDAFTHEFGGHL